MASCRGSFRDFVEQALGLLLQREDIGADLAEVNKTSLRFEVQTPAFRPRLVAALAGIRGRKQLNQPTKEKNDESED